MTLTTTSDSATRETDRLNRFLREAEELADDLRALAETARNLTSLIPKSSVRGETCQAALADLREELGSSRPSPKAVQGHIDRLRSAIFRQDIEDGSPGTEVAPAPSPGTPPTPAETESRFLELLSDVLVQVCGRFALYWPGRVKDKADAYAVDLRTSYSIIRHFSHLEKIFDLFALLRQEMDRDRGLHMEVLKKLVMGLLELEREFLETMQGEEAEDRRQSERDFQDRIGRNIIQIENALDSGDALEEIRDRVVQRIEAIKQAVLEKRKTDDDRSRRMRERLVKLESQLRKTKDRFEHIRTEGKRAMEQARMFRMKSMLDPLTQAYNRSAIDVYMKSVVDRGEPEAALLLFDVDRFKAINDTFGHTTGDRVLEKVVEISRRSIRKNDFLARLGGDEFLILLKHIPRDTVTELGEKLRWNLASKPFRLHRSAEEYVTVTVSVGIAFLEPSDTSESWLERADKALYTAKHSGRNRVVTEYRA